MTGGGGLFMTLYSHHGGCVLTGQWIAVGCWHCDVYPKHDRQTPSSVYQAEKCMKTNFFMFRNNVSTEMGEPHDITVYDDKRRDVTTMYGFWQEVQTAYV